MSSFAVAQPVFSGPLGLLLDLIESEKLPVTEVSLAKVAEEYLAFIAENPVPPEDLADFLGIAARLIYIKSRELLPRREDDEDTGGDLLVERLKMYEEYARQTVVLAERFGLQVMHVGPSRFPPPTPSFAPSKSLTSERLHEAYDALLVRLQPFFLLEQTSLQKVATLEEQIEKVREQIEKGARLSFSHFTRQAKSKSEVIVSFLALLELWRRAEIRLEQAVAFSDILIDRDLETV